MTIAPSTSLLFGFEPISISCPHCRTMVVTEVTRFMGKFAWVSVVFLFCFTIILFFLPFCLNYFKDSKHQCPQCKKVIAVVTKWDFHQWASQQRRMGNISDIGPNIWLKLRKKTRYMQIKDRHVHVYLPSVSKCYK